MRWTLFVSLLALGAPLAARAQIVGHAAIDAVAALPQCVMDGIGAQRWFFTHASVGGNLLEGLDDLRAADPARYRLTPAWVGYDEPALRAEAPPAPTVPGTVYECDRGNPSWQDKLAVFDNSVRLAGWRLAAVDVVMNKMCFIDQAASAATYLASMDALAASYPATVFVYTTMPLTVDEDADNVLRNLYNRAVRLHCAASGALLYDLADMEAHDPAGGEHTFLSGGQTYQKLYAGYTSDGGHLDTDLGHRRLAQGWYAAAATLAPCRAFADGFESGDTGRWSAAVP
ncbi:MAG: hypothetical protein H6Q03_2635 [Acidobacteria bacterium]|nr:hypothetical protein [Acidobacteriota bacterium]